MKILVVNCGSSSLKYQLLDMTDESVIAKGLVERIGIQGSILIHEKEGADKYKIEEPLSNHKEAISLVLKTLVDPVHGGLKSMDEISAVGHRVVHGGEYYNKSVVITPEVMKTLVACIELAPLHNPPNISGIEACQELMPETPMVAVFDTAFHQTMEPASYIYPIPYEYYEKYKVRRYGFHGTSHKFISERAAEILGKNIEDTKIITCHLGNGSSLAAIKGGKTIDTTMGFTPLEGLPMGTRSGDLDPAIISYVMEKEDMTIKSFMNVLNKKSGALGISGISSDFRDIENAAAEGDVRAQLSLDVFAQKVKCYIGSYFAEMNGADMVVFSAGIGENGIDMREMICSELDALGMEFDKERNQVRGKEAEISKPGSKVKIYVIPTNEEIVIARDTLGLTK